jgi:putative transcription factor
MHEEDESVEECELCGTRINETYTIDLDGTELRVCAKCAKGKVVLRSSSETRIAPVRRSSMKEEPPLKENYGEIIREARERMKLPIKVLAEMINEKETFILRVEEQKMQPDMKLAKKLEKALGIKLAAERETTEGVHSRGNTENATLGEFINR